MSDKTIEDANDTMVTALVAERAGYARRGDKFKDRIAQVDEQLKLRGFNGKGEPLSKPQGRQAPPQQTA